MNVHENETNIKHITLPMKDSNNLSFQPCKKEKRIHMDHVSEVVTAFNAKTELAYRPKESKKPKLCENVENISHISKAKPISKSILAKDPNAAGSSCSVKNFKHVKSEAA